MKGVGLATATHKPRTGDLSMLKGPLSMCQNHARKMDVRNVALALVRRGTIMRCLGPPIV